LNFLKSDQRVKELLSSDSIPPVKINVDSNTGDIVAIFCRKLGASGLATKRRNLRFGAPNFSWAVGP